MLERVHSPEDIKGFTQQELSALAAEIRQTLVDTVSQTGGHLASNLGAVELTLALHRAFHTPEDKIIFDVGHQSYTHKLLTGRVAAFSTLRQEGGLSGFPKRGESVHDVFETGHASTAISAALGFARARDALGEDHAVVALVGDGAMTGGLCYEALNDAGSRPTQMIMLLNDNKMSIAKNVGALSKYLTRLRGSEKWTGAKKVVKYGLSSLPLVGRPLSRAVERTKRSVKLMLVPGEFFEALGFVYLGPIDGHDTETLERTLRDAYKMRCPVVVHAVTQKGRGYALAERRPDQYHGVAPFFVEDGQARGGKSDGRISTSSVVGEALVGIAEQDERAVAITAAMPQGTGLSAFEAVYPDRFFDVGIAEEHAMTMAAGMAAGGLRPIFVVYASFLQRTMDQLLHDICLQQLPVLVLADHAGFVSGDGATHQGVYDLSMLRAMPGLTIWSPCDALELRTMLFEAFGREEPCVIRYPKDLPDWLPGDAEVGKWRCVNDGERLAIIGTGATVETAISLRDTLGFGAVYSASSISPMDEEMLSTIARHSLVAVLEESQYAGGLGEAVAAHYSGREGLRVLSFAIEGIVPDRHSLSGLAEQSGLDVAHCAARIQEALA